MSSKILRKAAIAILYQENQFLLQLRDNIPHILYPDQWTLFGGHLEGKESPDKGIKREIWEEIGYQITDFKLFNTYQDENAQRYVFAAPLKVSLDHLNLQEGSDFALVSPSAIQGGQCYSPKIKQQKPLAPIHQKILLDFLKSTVK